MAKSAKKSIPAAVEEVEVPVQEVEVPAIEDDTSVYDQLLECIRSEKPDFKEQGAKEDVQVFLRRFLSAISDVSPEAWDKLEEDGAAQTWFNDEVDNHLTPKLPIDPPPGMTVIDAALAEEPKVLSKGAQKLAEINAKRKADKALREAAGADPKAPSVSEKKAAPKVPKEKVAKAPAGPRPEGVTGKLRRMVLENNAITVAEMLAKATAMKLEGVKASTASTIRADTMATVSIAKSLGLIK